MDQKITHQGVLEIGEFEIPCYVLEDGTRILSTSAMQKALSITTPESSSRTGSMIDKFLNGGKSLKQFIEEGNYARKIQTFPAYYGKRRISGLEAQSIVDFCELMLKARESITLTKKQKEVAMRAEILIRSFAKIGVIALVDEATGYQFERERDELQKVLKRYISEELLPWQKRFPDEFYKEIFRLNGWGYFMKGNINIKDRPGVIGHWTKKYVYSILPRGVLNVLLDKTPRNQKGKLKHKLHQRLTKEEGIEHLNKILVSVVTLMNVADDWKHFERLWNKKFGQQALQFDDYKMIEPQRKQSDLSDFNQKLVKALKTPPKD